MPDMDRMAEGLDHHFHFAIALGSKDIGGKKPHAGRQRQHDVGHGRTVRGALFTLVGQWFPSIAGEYASLNGMDGLSSPAALFLDHAPFDAAVDEANRDAFSRRPRVMQKSRGSQKAKQVFEKVLGHAIVSGASNRGRRFPVLDDLFLGPGEAERKGKTY